MNTYRRRACVILGLALLSGVYLFLAARLLHIPGYQTDEGFYMATALNLARGLHLDEHVTAHITLFDRRVPLMHSAYIGSLQSLLLVPFARWIADPVLASRLLPLLLSVLILWLTWDISARLASRRIAAMTTLLLAVNAGFVLWSRTGTQGEGPLQVCLFLAALALLLRWRDSDAPEYAYAAMTLLGLGLATKINFLFLLCGLAAFGSFYRRAFTIPRSQINTAFGFFLVGFSPSLFTAFTQGFPLFAIIGNALTDPTVGGENNLAFDRNLSLRVNQFIALLGGGAYYTTAQKTPNPWYAVLVCIAAAGMSIQTIRRRARYPAPVILLACVLSAAFLGQCFTVSGFYVFHLFILFPFPQLAIALFIDHLADQFPRAGTWLRAGILVLIVGTDLGVLYVKYTAWARAGDGGDYGTAIYALSASLEQRGIHRPLTLDARVKYPLSVLTGGRVDPLLLTNLPQKELSEAISSFIAHDDAYVILLSSAAFPRPRMDMPQSEFISLAAARGRSLYELASFSNGTGERMYRLYRCGRDTRIHPR